MTAHSHFGPTRLSWAPIHLGFFQEKGPSEFRLGGPCFAANDAAATGYR
jgi:hypothetical protein